MEDFDYSRMFDEDSWRLYSLERWHLVGLVYLSQMTLCLLLSPHRAQRKTPVHAKESIEGAKSYNSTSSIFKA